MRQLLNPISHEQLQAAADHAVELVLDYFNQHLLAALKQGASDEQKRIDLSRRLLVSGVFRICTVMSSDFSIQLDKSHMDAFRKKIVALYRLALEKIDQMMVGWKEQDNVGLCVSTDEARLLLKKLKDNNGDVPDNSDRDKPFFNQQLFKVCAKEIYNKIMSASCENSIERGTDLFGCYDSGSSELTSSLSCHSRHSLFPSMPRCSSLAAVTLVLAGLAGIALAATGVLPCLGGLAALVYGGFSLLAVAGILLGVWCCQEPSASTYVGLTH